jgi:ribosomal protein S18 acetylase RimI-like enzyme
MTDLRQVSETHTPFHLSLRDEEPCDREFLARLFASTREHDMLLSGWPSEQQAAFLSMQFHAQTMHYDRVYAGARRSIVLANGDPAGRLFVFGTSRDLRIVDISLLPRYRGQGVGTVLLQSVIEDANSAGLSVSLHVAAFNPARRLYERLGFQPTDAGDGAYIAMRRDACVPCELGC